MKIIAFGHRKKVGKDTAVRFLSQEIRLKKPGCNIMVAGFADKVKDVAYQLYAWAELQPKHYYDSNYPEKEIVLPKIGLTPRAIWIGVGNGIRLAVSDQTWAEYLFNQPKVDYLFINDLRFPTEADHIKQRGGKVIRIDRPDQPKDTDGADDPLESYDSWDGILLNDKGIKEFHTTVMGLLPELLV